jgi:hypothetical protein
VYTGGDDYDSIRAVFGPVIEQLERAAKDINCRINTTTPWHCHRCPSRYAAPYLSDECDTCNAGVAGGAIQVPIHTTPYRFASVGGVTLWFCTNCWEPPV